MYGQKNFCLNFNSDFATPIQSFKSHHPILNQRNLQHNPHIYNMKKEINFNAVIEVYESAQDLTAADEKLLFHAKEALPAAFAPYSGFQVSAAVLLANNEMVVGTNHENAAYPMCLCAERVALAAAHAQFPGIPVKTIAITVKSKHKTIAEPVSPCGACRQVICETEHRYRSAIQIILQGETGVIYKLKSGKDLLPLAFDGDFL